MKRVVLAFDIGGTNVKSGLIDDSGALLTRQTAPSQAKLGRDALLTRLHALIGEYRRAASERNVEIAAIGIGTAGYVDRHGTVAYATDNIPGWTGVRLQDDLESLYKMPVSVVNDVFAIAAGEAWTGAGRSFERFLCVSLGTGTGACLWEDGKPYPGDEGFAGAIGHQVIEIAGRLCTCGQRGCWEAYASVSALRAILDEPGEKRRFATPEQLFEFARAGDLKALQLVRRYAGYVAAGLLNPLYALNVKKIVLTGAIAQQGVFLADLIRQRIADTAMPIFVRDDFEIVTSALGDDAGVVGAARPVIHHAK